MGSMKDLNRERAKYAMIGIQGMLESIDKSNAVNSEENKKLKKTVRSYCQSVSTYIRVNGIVNAIAFIENKKEKPKNEEDDNTKIIIKDKHIWNEIYSILDEWFNDKLFSIVKGIKKEQLKKHQHKNEATEKKEDIEITKDDKLIEKFVYIKDRNDYRKASKEMLEFSGWLKKIAEAMIEVRDEKEE